MCKQHPVEVSLGEREKSVVPKIEIQSCEEPVVEISKRDTFTHSFGVMIYYIRFQAKSVEPHFYSTAQVFLIH